MAIRIKSDGRSVTISTFYKTITVTGTSRVYGLSVGNSIWGMASGDDALSKFLEGFLGREYAEEAVEYINRNRR